MIRVRVRLVFPEALVRVPVVATMVRRFDVEPNIRRAEVEDEGGWMLLEVDGHAPAVDEALGWLRDEGVEVELLGDVLEG